MRNDRRTGLVNGQTARVAGIEEDQVRFQLEDGDTITMGEGDPHLRFLDHAWASTVHALQGRTVDAVIATMESRNPMLVNQKSLYVAISRARYGWCLPTCVTHRWLDHDFLKSYRIDIDLRRICGGHPESHDARRPQG